MSELLATSFTDAMSLAERLYARGAWTDAAEHFNAAKGYALEHVPPDYLGAARAARGSVQSEVRAGTLIGDDGLPLSVPDMFQGVEAMQHQAEQQAGRSQDEAQIHEVSRERVQTSAVIGRMMLERCVEKEQSTGSVSSAEHISTLEAARQTWGIDLPVAEMPGRPDQYRVNSAATIALIEILYGNKKSGRHIARQAWRLAPLSETKHVTGSVDRGPELTKAAQNRAKVRAATAIATGYIAGKGAKIIDAPEANRRYRLPLRRRIALAIAKRVL
jgi:hypothetical protein